MGAGWMGGCLAVSVVLWWWQLTEKGGGVAGRGLALTEQNRGEGGVRAFE